MATRKNASPPVEYASAMDKIRDEMAKSQDNYTQVVGEYLTGYLLQHPEAEEKLLDSGKSVKGSLETVRKEAEKVKNGNMAVLDDRTVFGIVLGYFGLKSEPEVLKTGENVTAEAGNSLSQPKADSSLEEGALNGDGGAQGVPADPFDLDALLGVM